MAFLNRTHSLQRSSWLSRGFNFIDSRCNFWLNLCRAFNFSDDCWFRTWKVPYSEIHLLKSRSQMSVVYSWKFPEWPSRIRWYLQLLWLWGTTSLWPIMDLCQRILWSLRNRLLRSLLSLHTKLLRRPEYDSSLWRLPKFLNLPFYVVGRVESSHRQKSACLEQV